MTQEVLIYENANQDFFYPNIVKSWKIKRGWIHIVLMNNYRVGDTAWVVWTLRERQYTCELLKSFQEVYYDEPGVIYQKALDWVKTTQFILTGRRSRSTKVRDSQRRKVYNWERVVLDYYNSPTLTHNEMTDFVKKVTAENGIVLRKLKYRSGGSCSFARSRDELQFLPCHMNKIIACHEIAHLIVNDKWIKKVYEKRVAGHGPEFVREYVNLLVKYCGFNEAQLVNSLKLHKVKIA